MKNLRPSSKMSWILMVGLIINLMSLAQAQDQSQQQDSGRTTLVVSQDANGGLRLVDRNSNRQLVNTNGQQILTNDFNVEGGDNGQVVNGLLDFIEKLKGKKRDPQQLIMPIRPMPMPMPLPPMPQPILPPPPPPLPLPLPYPGRKEIHIHINNHMKKKGHHQHHHKKQHHYGKKHGHYEDYHDGHYEHSSHDKHYYGKHSYPLLSHHFNWDLYDPYDGRVGEHHYDPHHDDHDDYGYESKKILKFASVDKKPKKSDGVASKENRDNKKEEQKRAHREQQISTQMGEQQVSTRAPKLMRARQNEDSANKKTRARQ